MKNKSTTQLKGVLYASFCALLLASTGVLSRSVMLSDIGGIKAALWRTIFAFLTLSILAFVFYLFSKKEKRPLPSGAYMVYLGIARGVSNAMFMIALGLLSATMASIANRMIIPFTLILAIATSPREAKKLKWGKLLYGIIAIASGFFFIFWNSLKGEKLCDLSLAGISFMLIASFSWSCFTVGQERHSGTSLNKSLLWQRLFFQTQLSGIAVLVIGIFFSS